YGRAIARLHNLADGLPTLLRRPRIDFESIVERPIAAFESVVTHRLDAVAYAREVAEVLRPLISALPVAAPRYGLVHGDVIPSNVQVTPEGEVAVLDFDFCGYCWRAYDVATYLGEVAFWEAAAAAADAFLDGYGEVRPLREWELRMLPAFTAARHIQSLGTPAMNVNEWGSAYLSDCMIDTLIGAIRKSMTELT
ncbi:MAG: phosphotransferase, partial [Chloroflexota bacterium]|nr:phosphotransferase [Chloroflexota bacterium]